EVIERTGNGVEIAAPINRLGEGAIAAVDVTRDRKHFVVPPGGHYNDAGPIGHDVVTGTDRDAAAANRAVDFHRPDAPLARHRRDVAAAHGEADRLHFVHVAAA